MLSIRSRGVIIAIAAALVFGGSGPFIKPLLESGWSPAAAVTARALIGAVVLAPAVIWTLRGRWRLLLTSWRRVLMMGLIGVAGTQLAYFASLERIHVGTAILIEYLAPVLLVAWVWARSHRAPRPVVIIGSAVAIGGLVLVVGPGAIGPIDPLGLAFAITAMVGCAIYFVIAAQPSDGLPPVALAGVGLFIGALALAAVGATGLIPFRFSTAPVVLFDSEVPALVPLLIVGVLSTALAYVLSISASELLGSRLASFLGLLEVVAATVYAWILLGESLSLLQVLGGALILGGIVLVRADRTTAPEAHPEQAEELAPKQAEEHAEGFTVGPDDASDPRSPETLAESQRA